MPSNGLSEMMRVTKNMYLAGFAAIVVVLAVVRCAFPSVAEDRRQPLASADTTAVDSALTVVQAAPREVKQAPVPYTGGATKYLDAHGKPVKHRILSVSSFDKAFPDNNDVQLTAANEHGVKPFADRRDAERHMGELVYVGACPYYHVDKMARSIPYLVPRAAVLLSDIGRAYYDSLQVKGIPLHQFIVTSVLRTQEDVGKLSSYNINAIENSCHLYGTTFDICQNRYHRINDPDMPESPAVRDDTLKWILSEVLEDMRLGERCYVKYEKKQGCFHITVR